jgi:two-component system, chemotaxis family, sensor kinase CheA
VKPLGPHLGGLDVFAGATILGDGRVAAIVDVVGLADRAGVILADPVSVEETPAAPSTASTPLLVFADGSGARMAVPLEMVERLEAFPKDAIERSGARDFVRYRDRILPLTCVDELVLDRRGDRRYSPDELPDDVQVVVHRDGETLLGVVVGRIIDVVDEPLELEPGSRPGVRGTMIVGGRVTEILDLRAFATGGRGAAVDADAEVAS